MFKSLKEKAGYVSIETIIIAGLMLALGVAILIRLFEKGESLSTVAVGKIDTALSTVTSTVPAE